MCSSFNTNFILWTYDNKCLCYEQLPEEQLTLISNEACSLPCSENVTEHCKSENIYSAYVNDCENGWIRFGDTCFKSFLQKANFTANAEFCIQQNSTLWSPKSFEESEFVSNYLQQIGISKVHTGILSFNSIYGFTTMDGTYSSGIDFITHNSVSPLNSMNNLDKITYRYILSTFSGRLRVSTIMEEASGLCSRTLGLTFFTHFNF